MNGRHNLLRCGTTVLAVALVWVAAFRLNELLFSSFAYTPRANWIFLPAALRLIVILLFRQWGMFGLILGAWFSGPGNTEGDAAHEIFLSCTSGIAPMLAVAAGKRWFGIPDSLAGLNARHICMLSISCAAANAVLLNAYLLLSGRLHWGLAHVATVFTGDVLGAFLVLALLSAVLSFAIPRAKPHKP